MPAPSEIHIRKATRRDLSAIVRHRRRMFAEMGYVNSRMLDKMTRNATKLFERWMKSGAYHGWMAVTRDGKVIGGGGVGITDWPPIPRDPQARRATIFNVFVEPRYRRQGLARSLMNVMIEWCREQGFAVVNLHSSNAGRPLYESLGFKATTEMRLKLTTRKSKHRSRQPKLR
jgi:GNAT superfamily N-acetyltransferase